MNVVVKKTREFDKVYGIAKSLPHYFNSQGLKSIKRDVRDAIVFGAFVNDEIVGFIVFKELNQDALEIAWMAVTEKLQNKGIGSQLVLDGLKKISGKYKVCEVKTLSEKDPDPLYARTRNFYTKLGFIPIETIIPYPGWGADNPCQIFVKFLKP